MKKLLSVLLCVLMLASVAIIPAAAVDEPEAAPSVYFALEGTALPGGAYAPESRYEEFQVWIVAENATDYVYLTAVEVSNGLRAGDGWLNGETTTEPYVTVPAGLAEGVYHVTYKVTYKGAESFITLTLNIPCPHEKTYFVGKKDATLFNDGFSGVEYCYACHNIVDMGHVEDAVLKNNPLHQMYVSVMGMAGSIKSVVMSLIKGF